MLRSRSRPSVVVHHGQAYELPDSDEDARVQLSIRLSERIYCVYDSGEPSKVAAVELATEVLKSLGKSDETAKQLAEVTYDSPLATVIGAQIVAKENLHPNWLGEDKDFRELILARFT